MKDSYSRNRIYITPQEQEKIKNYPILLAGCGIGSNIAECALRLGFENITIIDGDQIEKSNLNRQNYTTNDLGKDKVITLKERLLSINPNAQIKTHKCFIDTINLDEFLNDCKIAINVLDFDSDIPLLFDKRCQKQAIPILHPYNLGWAGLVTVIAPNGKNLSTLHTDKNQINEVFIVKHFFNKLEKSGINTDWLKEILQKYTEENENLSPPQLSVGSWLVAGICTTILFNIATEKEVRYFPELYYNTIM